MTRIEFAAIIGTIAAALGKPLEADRQEVYYDLLGDLPCNVLQAAAARVCLQHRWASFPLPAELRDAAAAMTAPETEITPAAAWEMAWRAARKIDLEVDGSLERATIGLPAIVLEAMRAFGVTALCHGGESVGVVRGQFLKIFEQIAGTRKREALLPASLRPQIEKERKQIPARVVALLESMAGKVER